MRDRSDKTRFGFPPEANPPPQLPAEIPWETPISDLAAFWLEVTCSCGRSSTVPLRLVAAEHGWGRTLRQIVVGLKCSGFVAGHRCGKPAARILLVRETYSGGRDKQRPELRLVP